MRIFDAWRLPAKRLKDLLTQYQLIMRPVVEDRIFSLLMRTPKESEQGPLSPADRLDLVWTRVKAMGDSLFRDIDNPEGSAAIHLAGRFAYIRCFGEYDYEKLFAKIEILGYENFDYTDQTDCQAEELGYRAWRKRGRIWQRVLETQPMIFYFFQADRMFFVKHFNWGYFSGTRDNPDFHVPERFKPWFEDNAKEYWQRTVIQE